MTPYQSVRTDNWVLLKDFMQVPAGAYVKPIEAWNLPRHIKETAEYTYLNQELEVFIYTSKGMFKIQRCYISVRD